jgi:phosphate transport system substrate-binding protein
MKHRIHLLILFLFLLSFVSCKKTDKGDGWDDTLSSGFIRIACDESFKTLMDTEIDVFEAHNPSAIIVPVYTNETEAIRLLISDSVRFALTTRDLRSKERAELKSKLMEARKHLIAFDGIALIMNPVNNDSLMGMPTLKKILTGEIAEWSQINPNSPLGTIRVIVDGKESGVFRYVMDSIVRKDSLTQNIYALNNASELIEKVIQMPNALGFISINALDANTASRNKVRLMRIGKEEPAILENTYLPYAGDIWQENYPLWRPLYVLLSDPKSGLSSGLSIFLSREIGQKVLLKEGLLPITDAQNRSVNIKDEYPE